MITNIVSTIITAYCACQSCCGPQAKGITAQGTKPIQGITIAASRRYAFGTDVYIPKVGWRKVQDRLAKRYDSRVDVYFASHQEAKKFGIRTNNITIITK